MATFETKVCLVVSFNCPYAFFAYAKQTFFSINNTSGERYYETTKRITGYLKFKLKFNSISHIFFLLAIFLLLLFICEYVFVTVLLLTKISTKDKTQNKKLTQIGHNNCWWLFATTPKKKITSSCFFLSILSTYFFQKEFLCLLWFILNSGQCFYLNVSI